MKIVIRKSGKKGKGVFASRNIRKGEIILEKDYTKNTKIVNVKEISKLSEKDQNHIDYIGKGKYAVGYSPVFMINHSCEPNCYINHKNSSVRKVVAIRNIEKGKEICCDYAIDTTGKWKMKCLCRNENCRKIIYGDYNKLPKELQKKYWKLVPRRKKSILKGI